MTNFSLLCDLLARNVTKFSKLRLSQLLGFLALSLRLKNEILLTQPSTHKPDKPPMFLPPAVVGFLAAACELDRPSVTECWTVLKDTIWSSDPTDDTAMSAEAVDAFFYEHGPPFGFVSPRTIWPPTLVCCNPDCDRAEKGFKLQRAECREVILYTLSHGPLAVHKRWPSGVNASCTIVTIGGVVPLLKKTTVTVFLM